MCGAAGVWRGEVVFAAPLACHAEAYGEGGRGAMCGAAGVWRGEVVFAAPLAGRYVRGAERRSAQ